MNTLKTISLAAGVLATAAIFADAQTTIVWQVASNGGFVSGADEVVDLNLTGGSPKSFDAQTILNETTPVNLTITIPTGKFWIQDKEAQGQTYTVAAAEAVSEQLMTATGLELKSGKPYAYGNGAGGQPATLTFSNLAANKTYAFSFLFEGDSASSVLSATTGTLVTSAADVKATDGSGVMTEVDFANYNFYANVTDAGEVNSIIAASNLATTGSSHKYFLANALITADAEGKVVFNATQKPWFAGIAISTVPEPSMFGLLAGLGALALVGARRRRSR
ncbi:MAG: PEP-CTERM sorting domain-containing protein [Opitutales bacterium]|nr:PEP-CTERM sorting domain-containing protein [Opitutales bacterium]